MHNYIYKPYKFMHILFIKNSTEKEKKLKKKKSIQRMIQFPDITNVLIILLSFFYAWNSS